MTSPIEPVRVTCPECGEAYEDWYRASINLTLDDFDDAYVAEASSAKCPTCGFRVRFDSLIVDEDGVFTSVAAMPKRRRMKKDTLQIGRTGELLVQYRLLRLGVESAPMTTDRGVDLVAFNPTTGRALTIQVKANERPKPGGGKGKAALDWWVPVSCPAELYAFVDLSSERVWLMTAEELAELAQQESKGRFHLYMYTDPTVEVRSGKLARVGEFERFLLEHQASSVLGAEVDMNPPPT
jgi:hypothetical protein